MAHQVEDDDVKKIPLSESTCYVKEEQCKEDDLVDDKVHIFPTAISVDNGELDDDIGYANNMKQFKISTSLDDITTELLSFDLQHNIINDNIKIEEETNDEKDIKIEFKNGLLYCENCHAYYEDYCIKCGMLVHILNKTILYDTDNKAQELPSDILEIQESFGQLGVFALKVIPKKVKFGPFTGLDCSECPLKIKGGKFVANKATLQCTNWMQYINPARNVSEQNLHVLQCGNNIYYESTCQILEGDELLIYFDEDNKDCPTSDFEMDFNPTTEPIFGDIFACTFCCLGFSSKSYLAKHKTICLAPAAEYSSIKELTQCSSCKIHLDRNEYIQYHVAYCCKRNYLPPTLRDQTADVNGRRTRHRRIYKCQRCKYTTKYKGDLYRHANKHNEVKAYKCGICNRRFKAKDALRLHEENAHVYVELKEEPEHSTGDYKNPQIMSSPADIKQFKCSLCDFRTKYKSHRKRHITMKHLKKYFKCDTCGHKTMHKSLLKIHIKSKHLAEFDYKCGSCEYETNTKWHLEYHRKAKHLKEFKYKCESCTYKTNYKSNLKVHVKAKHLDKFDYECDICNYKTTARSNLERHRKTHFKEFHYRCDSCQFRTNRKDQLGRHIKSKHLDESEYRRDISNNKITRKSNLDSHGTAHLREFDSSEFKTNRKDDLEKHIKSKHLDVSKYKCDICNYEITGKSNLERHRATHLQEFDRSRCELIYDACNYESDESNSERNRTAHLKEFNFRCDSCQFKTNRKDDLEKHIKSKHLDVFNYKCDICNYETTGKSNLERHRTTHLKKFDYRCDCCQFRTNRKDELGRHIKSKHLDEFDYKCEICNYKTSSKSNLERHKTTHLKEFVYRCDSCQFKTNRQDDLEKHVKSKHLNVFDYKCGFCGYKTNYRGNLEIHETTHLNEHVDNSKVCPYKTNPQSGLERHARMQRLKETDYRCDLRQFRTNSKEFLKKRINSKHLDEFEYKCEICDYKANYRGNLETHRTAHLNEYVHNWEACGYKTNGKSDLERHVKTQHPKEFEYKCDLCDYKTYSMTNFQDHMMSQIFHT